jgi:multidrug efflux system membrane fusion protein
MATQETQTTIPPGPGQAAPPGPPDAGQMPPGPQIKAPTGPPHQNDPDGKHDPGKPGRLLRLALILIVVFGILLIVGILPRLHQGPQLKSAAKAQQDATPSVEIVPVQKPAPSQVLTLPGNVQAIQQTAITARASGYIKRWYADIGDRVKAGQVLATISTPDVDQTVAQARDQLAGSQAALSQAQANLVTQQANLSQARANLSRSQASYDQSRTDLAHAQASLAQAQEQAAQQQAQVTQAQANLNLARVTAQRYQNLLADGAIDQQTTDQSVASYQTSLANVQALQSALRASEANVVAFADAVRSSRSNVQAFAQGVRASGAAVAGAAANVKSYRAAVAAATQNVRSNQANLARNVALQGFQKVTAPFAGVVTARNVDNGALITAGGVSGSGSDSTTDGSGSVGSTSLGNPASGSSTGSGSSPGSSPAGASGGTANSLFSIAQTNLLRIYINVPQTYASDIRPGQTAQVLVQEVPNHPFLGKVVRTSAALDAASRTLVSEVDVPNPQGLLRPGTIAQVRLRVSHPEGALQMPDSALLTNAGGTQTLVVGQDDKIHYQTIKVGRDFGKTIEVISGLQAGQNVVANPNDSLHEGEKVHTVAAPPPTQGG